MSEVKLAQYISNVVCSVSGAHTEHLNTYKYARHKTLDEYYKGMPEVIDNLAEIFLGVTQDNKIPAATLKYTNLDTVLATLIREGEVLCTQIPVASIRTSLENTLEFMGHIKYKLKIN